MALSQPVGELIAALETPQGPGAFDCDLLIIGSGYGGAVAAARLAGATEAGRPLTVWLLERGAEHEPGRFPSRFAELPGQVRFSMQNGAPSAGRELGLLDARIGPDLNLLLGNGLGGGSLINANVMVRPEDAVFQQGWPASLDAPSLRAAYDRAEAMLKPAPLPKDIDLGKLAALRGLAGAGEVRRAPVHVNWDGQPSAAGVAMSPCTLCGDCLTGCNQGAKGSLDTNYLAWARQRGVRMFTGASGLWLAPVKASGTSPQGWELHWQPTDSLLRLPAGKMHRPVRARRVVVAAGALGSTELLLRSAHHGLALSPRLGERFSMNGDAIAAGIGHPSFVGAAAQPEADPADAAARLVGPTITGLARVPAEGDSPGFIVEEFGVPGALRRTFGEIATTLGLLRGGVMPGSDPVLCTDAHIDRMSLYGLMGDDGPADELGKLTLSGELAEGGIQVVWPELARKPLFGHMARWLAGKSGSGLEAASAAEFTPLDTARGPNFAAATPPQGDVLSRLGNLWQAVGDVVATTPVGKAYKGVKTAVKDRLIDGLADRVSPPTLLALLADGDLGLMVSVHPLGGCAMGDNIEEGVVDHLGQVFSPGAGVHPGLVVLDGSIVPRALGINPALTITALAERAVPLLVKESAWRLKLAASDAPPTLDAAALKAILSRAPGRRRELPPENVSWMLRECLQGPFPTSAGLLWGRMELEYEEIPGFSRALQMPERVIIVRKGELKLYEFPRDWPSSKRQLDELLSFDADVRPIASAALAGSLRLFAPLNPRDPDDFRVTLDYRISLQSVSGAWSGHIAPGGRLDGRKTFGYDANATTQTSLLRQLTEASMRYDGRPLGTWRLDLNDLAARDEALLSIRQQSSLPDAVSDGLVAAMYVARRALPLLLLSAARALISPPQHHLAERFPGKSGGIQPEIKPLYEGARDNGARLSRYPAATGIALRTPVLLLHGMGASGSSFTLDELSLEAPNLLHSLRNAGHEVWVLDVRSSIGNEWGRARSDSAHWTADRIAKEDVAEAIRRVALETGSRIDVYAHCMGGIMFWMAVLGDERLGESIHSAVVSQTAFMLRPTPFNRTRGFLASYLLQYLQLAEVDTRPDLRAVKVGKPSNTGVDWEPVEGGQAQVLVDALLGQFPYPDDDIAEREKPVWRGVDWRVRRRADAIFGQLFQLDQVHPDVIAKLDALLGWVKMPMLAQAIHFARERQLTDSDGRNRWLDPETLRNRLPFPVLLIHGRHNRVFEWRGAWETFIKLREVRGDAEPYETTSNADAQHFGQGTATQLLLLEHYGHFDSVIGRHAGRDVFPAAVNFFEAADSLPKVPAEEQEPVIKLAEVNMPAVGPVLGWLRQQNDGDCVARVLLQAPAHLAGRVHLVMVPLRWSGGVPEAKPTEAVQLLWEGAFTATTLDLRFSRRIFDDLASSFAMLFMTAEDEPALGQQAPGWAVQDAEGRALPLSRCGPNSVVALDRWLNQASADQIDACQLSLPPRVRQAADQAAPAQRLRFALASCQWPHDLFDRFPAGASYQRLWRDALRSDGPQFLLAVGDQVYLDNTGGLFVPAAAAGVIVDADDEAERSLRPIYERNLTLAPARRALGRLPVYPMLDDHEVWDNWQGQLAQSTHPKVSVKAALALYERYQAALAPSTPLHAQGGYSYRMAPGGCHFFMLDTRSQRTLGSAAVARILPDDVIDALLDAIAPLPDHAPKFIVSPSPLLPPEREWLGTAPARRGEDSWSGFPASSLRLLEGIRRRGLKRVVLLSGDAHLSCVSRLVLDNGPEIISVVSSGLYTPWPFVNTRPDDILQQGRVEFGTAERPCAGTLSLLSLSTAAGYAHITVSRDEEPGKVPGCKLRVSLRGGNGATVDCEVDLVL